MASARQKPSGRWEARYRDPSGVMRARTFSIRPRRAPGSRRSRPTSVGVTGSTRASRDRHSRRGRRVPPDDCASPRDHPRRLHAHRRSSSRAGLRRVAHLTDRAGGRPPIHRREAGSGLAPKTLQKIRLVLRQILETARGSGAIKANPCDGIRMPRAKQADPTFLTADEVGRWLGRRARPTTCSCGWPPLPGCGRASCAGCR